MMQIPHSIYVSGKPIVLARVTPEQLLAFQQELALTALMRGHRFGDIIADVQQLTIAWHEERSK